MRAQNNDSESTTCIFCSNQFEEIMFWRLNIKMICHASCHLNLSQRAQNKIMRLNILSGCAQNSAGAMKLNLSPKLKFKNPSSLVILNFAFLSCYQHGIASYTLNRSINSGLKQSLRYIVRYNA